MSENRFTWVETHKELVDIIRQKRNQQIQLIHVLKKVGISGLHDENVQGERFELKEIDPFSFFCYLYKYGSRRRLKYLQDIAKEFNVFFPTDDFGIPSVNAQKVCLFPYESSRKKNEISRLWDFFESAIKGEIKNEQFEDVLQIKSTGKAKLTEGLFSILPENFFPINGPTKPYLKEVLGIDPKFNTYTEYLSILKQIKLKVSIPFYELSYEAWKWNDEKKKVNYWIFQGNPKVFNFETALRDEILTDWTVSAHKDKIKVGDQVILWITGDKSGCYALAEVTSEPHQKIPSPDDHLWKGENKSSLKVGIKITHNLVDYPILSEEIADIEELSNLKVGNQGTNFSATEEEYQAILDLSQSINEKQYWLYAPGENASLWDEFYQQGIMGLGWDKIGDLSKLQSRDEIKKALVKAYSGTGSKKNDVSANDDFLNKVRIGDIIIAKKGRGELLGYGIVMSDYIFDENRKNFQKTRKVEWKLKGNWRTDFSLVLKTLTDITKYRSDHADYSKYYERLLGIMGQNNKIVEKEGMNFALNTIFYGPPGTGKTYNTILRAAEIVENRKIDSYDEALNIFKDNLHNRIEFITFHQNYSYEDFIQGLRPETDNKSSLTFDKKDGVFKKIAEKALENIKLSEKAPEELSNEALFDNALEKFKEVVEENDSNYPINETAYIIEVEVDAFRYTADKWTNHANGLRMKFSDLKEFYKNGVKSRKDVKQLNNISGLASQHATYYFLVYEKIIKLLPKKIDALVKVEKKNFVIIIDEINRANISRVFGELITLIEPDKRSNGAIPLEARLPSGDSFIVPSNLYIIGTMNTADKSIALLDIALRRRFEFESMYPLYEINGSEIFDKEILLNINDQIIKSKGHDFQIGHAYFMGENEDLIQRMNKKVIPLLLEYFMNDEKEVKGILYNAGLQIEEDSWPIKITGKRA
ncbi:AAA family ATPase [Flavobacterium sp. RSSA_27]|uniref:AAA family ATPase n=1 Tax=Flavobacterium sp. RSSA_27 TaxID=3447667 RepID=UPI003F3CE5C1